MFLKRFQYEFLLVGAAVCFSTAGVVIKGTSLTSWQVASFRSLVGALALLLFLPSSRRGWSWRMLPVAAAFGATLVLFALSTKLTTAANAIFLESTAPVYVLLLSPLLLREKVRWSDGLFIALIGAGMWLVFSVQEHRTALASNPPLGNRLAAIAGLTWALAIMGLRWLGKKGSGGGGTAVPVVLANFAAFGFALPLALPIPAMGFQDALAILFLGFVQVGLAYLCMTKAMPHVPAFEASMLLLVEPALNPIWTWMARGERPSAPAVAGGSLILAATLAKSWMERR